MKKYAAGIIGTFVLCTMILPTLLDAQDRPSLPKAFPRQALAGALIPRDQWRPFPKARDRAAWEALPEDIRLNLIEEGERALTGDWDLLPATLILDFVRNGDRTRFDSARSQRRTRLQQLVVAECVENKGRFIDEIINGLWATCEETYWGSSAHLRAVEQILPDITDPYVELFAAETGALLAWTVYLLKPELDAVTPLVCDRVALEIDRHILTPAEKKEWGWMGFGGQRVNNWNPWINSNWLACILLMEPDETRRTAQAFRSLSSLDNFIKHYPADGGCDEGPGYWNRAAAAMFDCLETLYSATNGALNVYDAPLIREMGRFICRVHIHDNYVVNFADAPAVVNLSGDLIYRYGRRINDAPMMQLGAWAARQRGAYGTEGSLGRQMYAIFNAAELRKAGGAQPLLRDAWLPDIQVLTARDQAGSAKGLYLAAKGGHNAESHNHNDVGHFIIYVDGKPAIIDVGVENYTAKTFSSERYSIWTMQSAYHNLPTINGMMQKNGQEFAARDVRYEAGDRKVTYSLDLAGAWEPEAGITTWRRELVLNRGENITLTDRYDLAKDPASLTLSLMTPCRVDATAPGRIVLTGDGFMAPLHIMYDPGQLTVQPEPIDVTDSRLQAAWGNRVTRLLLTANAPKAQGAWTVTFQQERRKE